MSSNRVKLDPSHKQKYAVIGLMSGSSLDGVDLACCTLRRKNARWSFKIEAAQTVPYSGQWLAKLQKATTLSGEQLMRLDADYGRYLGGLVDKFINRYRLRSVDFIASHGHTVFHQPWNHMTCQLGSAAALFAATGLPVVNNFRSQDVALGGEGAPLVPVGDRLLFGAYNFCLNLGGIANISYEQGGKRVAYDVCFANMALNLVARGVGKNYDRDGRLASRGVIDSTLMKSLMAMQRPLRRRRPSLGTELFDEHARPLLTGRGSAEEKLRTLCEFIAGEIARVVKRREHATVLCTGGGAFNKFLMERIRDRCGSSVIVKTPSEEIIKYKEALVFALLGVLRVRGEINCLKSVTRALRDSSGGDLIGF